MHPETFHGKCKQDPYDWFFVLDCFFEVAWTYEIQHQESPLLPHFFETMLLSGGGRPRQVGPPKSMTSTGSKLSCAIVV
jgi:hypothetical protein